MCWVGYVGFKLGGYEQLGSKENKGSINNSCKLPQFVCKTRMMRFV